MKIFTDHDHRWKTTKLVINHRDHFYVLMFPFSSEFYQCHNGYNFTIKYHRNWIGRDDSYKIPF